MLDHLKVGPQMHLWWPVVSMIRVVCFLDDLQYLVANGQSVRHSMLGHGVEASGRDIGVSVCYFLLAQPVVSILEYVRDIVVRVSGTCQTVVSILEYVRQRCQTLGVGPHSGG